MVPAEDIKCPKCGSVEVRRSRRRSVGEGAARILGIRPYRCTSCYWRGYVRLGRNGSLSVMALSEHGMARLWALALQSLILLSAVGVCLLIFSRAT